MSQNIFKYRIDDYKCVQIIDTELILKCELDSFVSKMNSSIDFWKEKVCIINLLLDTFIIIMNEFNIEI